MLNEMKIRNAVIFGHGVLAICMGLVLFYLSSMMDGLLFEVVVVVAAILVAAAALLFAGLVDWFAAFAEGAKHIQRAVLYLIAGLSFVLAGFFLGYYPKASFQLLLACASVQALASGLSAFLFAARTAHHGIEQRTMYGVGIVSILFSGAMAALLRELTNQQATMLLAAYLCFLGVKMLFFSWSLHRKTILIKSIVSEAVAELAH